MLKQLTFLWVLILTASCSSGGNNTSAPTCERLPLQQEIENILDNLSTYAPNYDDVDFSVYIESENGNSFTYQRGSSTLNTRYQSASTSKWVTAVIILRLLDQGYLRLEDRPQDLIPGWPIAASDSLSDITLATLLSFTSGLKNSPPKLFQQFTCLDLPNQNFDDCVNAIALANAGNGAIPGSEYHYGSEHLQVAGKMAIAASGAQDWREVFQTFQAETGLFVTAAYDLPSSSNPRLAGGMHWTADEYIDFIRAFVNNQLLTVATKQTMLADQLLNTDIVLSPVRAAIQQDWHYGFGIWLECPSASFDCQQNVQYYSSPGAYGAYPFFNSQGNFFGMIARQGNLGTFAEGKTIYDAIKTPVEAWAACENAS